MGHLEGLNHFSSMQIVEHGRPLAFKEEQCGTLELLQFISAPLTSSKPFHHPEKDTPCPLLLYNQDFYNPEKNDEAQDPRRRLLCRGSRDVGGRQNGARVREALELGSW